MTISFAQLYAGFFLTFNLGFIAAKLNIAPGQIYIQYLQINLVLFECQKNSEAGNPASLLSDLSKKLFHFIKKAFFFWAVF